MKWPALLAGLVFVGVSLSWLSRDPELRRHAFGKGSSLSTAPGGLSLARAYLAEHQGADVSTLARPSSRAVLPPGGVLFRVEPRWFAPGPRPRPRIVFEHWLRDGGVRDGGAGDTSITDAGVGSAPGDETITKGAGARPESPALLSATEEEWVARGGRVVLAVDESYGPLAIDALEAGEPAIKVFPELRGVDQPWKLDPPLGLAGAGLVDATTIFAAQGAPVLARRAIGAGDLWLLSAPQLLSNQLLGEQQNLALLTALAGKGRAVVFDEYVHGLDDDVTPFELLRRWGLGPACALLAACGLGWFWRRAVTNGEPSPFLDLRTESVDLAYAVGELYQRALRPRDQLALRHARLVHELQHRSGLSAAAAQARAAALLEGRQLPPEGTELSPAEFRQHLEAQNRAFRRLEDGHRRRR